VKLSRRLIVAGVFLAFGLQGHHAHARGPSTPEERAKVIELTRTLERDPLNENADATRQWLREWTIEVPEIRFQVCNELLSHGFGENYPYSREINLQTILSGAVFALEHPDKARDDVGAYIAGVEGSFRMYEVLAKSRP
jgi:carboxypeptidase Q